tara:strand:+ start:561 stop:1031 length:471 start_codon:yes stop_codon:yes gene_type:complete
MPFDVGAEINAKEFHVYVGANDASGVYAVGTEEWKILQNARVSMSHPIFREPTTSGGVVTFTGAPDHNISGTMIFTRDAWNTSTFGLEDLLTVTSGEVPKKNWTIKFVDVNGTSTNSWLTFPNCKLSVVDISKSVEGGVKVDITIVCPTDPKTTSS